MKRSLSILFFSVLFLSGCGKPAFETYTSEEARLQRNRNNSAPFQEVDIRWGRSKDNGCLFWRMYFKLEGAPSADFKIVKDLGAERVAGDFIAAGARDIMNPLGNLVNYTGGIYAGTHTYTGRDGMRVQVPTGRKIIAPAVYAIDCKTQKLAEALGVEFASETEEAKVTFSLPGGGSELQMTFTRP